MTIPELFNDIIQKHLNVHAAWLPITNNFQLGDYGIICNDVFSKMGNITKEFQISFEEEEGQDATLEFSSEGTTIVRFTGGVEVPAFKVADIDTKLVFKFSNERSIFLKAPVIKVKQISNLHEIAKKLHSTKGWERKWKVIHQTYEAKDPLIISTIAPNTEITISGEVSLLNMLNAGSAGLNMSFNKEVGLKIMGKAGIIGLGLFHLKLLGKPVMGFAQEELYEMVPLPPKENDI